MELSVSSARIGLCWVGGAKEDRTPDLLRARQALSQLSYGPNVPSTPSAVFYDASFNVSTRLSSPASWWAWEDSNLRPHPYQGCALTT